MSRQFSYLYTSSCLVVLKEAMPTHMPSSIEDLRSTLSRILGIDRRGGKLVVRDDITLLLVNYNLVHMEILEFIKTRYPNIEIQIENYTQSTSGYVVIFVLKPQREHLTSSACFQITFVSVVFLFCICNVFWGVDITMKLI